MYPMRQHRQHRDLRHLRRRETRPQPTEKFVEDAALVRDSQGQAIQQLEALKEELQDDESLAIVEDVSRYMNNAIRELSTIVDEQAHKEIASALPPEQAAYQALLRLRAREHEVVFTSADEADPPATAEVTLTITVTDVNRAPLTSWARPIHKGHSQAAATTTAWWT